MVDYRILFERAPEAMIVADSAGRFIDANAAATVLFGASRERLLASHIYDFVFDHRLAEDAWRVLLSLGEQRGSFELRTGDGRQVLIEYATTQVAPDRLLSVVRDVTGQTRASIEYGQAAAIIDSSEDAIFSCSLTGAILTWNAGAERLTGYSALEILGKPLATVVAPESQPEFEAAIRTVRLGQHHRTRCVLQRADGARIDASLVASPLRSASRELVGASVIARDITEHRRLEEQFRQAQKMEAVGRLAGGIAHDFNNLLTAVLGFSEIAADRLPSDHAAQQDIQEIRKAGASAAALTRQLLAFSRKQLLQPQVLDVNEVLERMSGMLGRIIGEDIALVRTLAPDLAPVLADPGQLEQVVANLAINARDALPHGGSISIRTANVVLGDEFVAAHPGTCAGAHVLLSVSDDGVGMSAETQERLFEPFFTTKPAGKGTGLGLATVYGIIQQSGGSIWVTSELGRGTTFTIYLPAVSREHARRSADKRVANLGGNERILVVEDQAAVRDIAVAVLKRQGYDVTAAQDANEAMAGIEGGLQVDLLLTDVVMPGTNGVALAAMIDAVRPGLKILYMSGYTDDALLQHGALQSGRALLHKPFTPSALLTRVRELLDGVA